MPITPEMRADIARRRGQAAAKISDIPKRQRFVAAQGDVEDRARRKKMTPEEEESELGRLGREADDTEATGGLSQDVGLPTYKSGTAFVPKTGLAKLHRGEAVIPAKKNKNFIQKAIKHPGALRNAASRAGMSTQAFAQKHKHDSGKVGQRSRLAITLSHMHH